MNLKLNNEVRSSVNLTKEPPASVKEERRRTGRYIAILVGICLLMLAFYHAWVRKIPVVASLVVPALIMFVYVGWVLYTASRDKRRIFQLLDAEAALNAEGADDGTSENQANIEISVISSKETSKTTSPDSPNDWSEISSVFLKGNGKEENRVCFVKPIILINDKPHEDYDEKWSNIVETLTSNEKIKVLPPRRRFKRRFCRSRRHAIFKRSYSIG
ncbi:uncharacterized protein LOC121731916 [Aricia agestis]|uniref:uncharacterized protein LOC121731916 n=1 Tax=Aricia agestis TaxID=91739 RepID=UPI001C203EBA|nr:uncharacterized protein LOC121731916 [Aricia agestis]